MLLVKTAKSKKVNLRMIDFIRLSVDKFSLRGKHSILDGSMMAICMDMHMMVRIRACLKQGNSKKTMRKKKNQLINMTISLIRYLGKSTSMTIILIKRLSLKT